MSKGFFDIMGLWRRWYSTPEEVPAVVSERFDLIGTSTASFRLTGTRYTASGFYADQLDEMLVASPGPTALKLFSTEDFESDSDTVWNTDCWAASLDFTGCAWFAVDENDYEIGNAGETGTLISSRHALIAYHVTQHAVGNKVTWVAADGKSYMRTLLGLSDELGAGINHDLRMSYYGLPGTDTGIAATNPDLPSTLMNYRLLPKNYENYSVDFPPYVDQTPTVVMPIIVVDQERQALVREWFQMRIFGGVNAYIQGRNAALGNRPNYTEKLITGDSSHPKFVLMNGELVLLSTHFESLGDTPPYITNSPFLADDIDEINTAMAALEDSFASDGETTGYQLSIWAPSATPSTQPQLTGTTESVTLTGV